MGAVLTQPRLNGRGVAGSLRDSNSLAVAVGFGTFSGVWLMSTLVATTVGRYLNFGEQVDQTLQHGSIEGDAYCGSLIAALTLARRLPALAAVLGWLQDVYRRCDHQRCRLNLRRYLLCLRG